MQADLVRAQERWPDMTLETLQAGREDYVARCAGCHALRLPGSEPPDEWPHYIDEMINEHDVVLTPDERYRIEAYLITLSEAPDQVQ